MGGWSSTSGLANNAGIDPNAPLSTLLPAAPTPYKNTTTPGVNADAKLQYQADILGTTGTDTLTSATSLLGQPLDYWQKLLKTPTRTSLAEQQGPAISSVVGQYATGKKALAQQPRGGGTTATAAQLPFQESGAITGLLEQQLSQDVNVLQPEAAKAITDISSVLSGLGLEELGLSSQDLSSLISADISKRGQNMQALGDLGKGIGSIFAAIIAKS